MKKMRVKDQPDCIITMLCYKTTEGLFVTIVHICSGIEVEERPSQTVLKDSILCADGLILSLCVWSIKVLEIATSLQHILRVVVADIELKVNTTYTVLNHSG